MESSSRVEFYQQFMDVSKPLPDVPYLEPERGLDPTTAEWDRRMGRPADFWRSMPEEVYQGLASESGAAAGAFPWGAKRHDAMLAGWESSCYGSVTWWDNPEPKSKDECFRHWRRCVAADAAGPGATSYWVRQPERLVGLVRGFLAAQEKVVETTKTLLDNYELSQADRDHMVAFLEQEERKLEGFNADAEVIQEAEPKATLRGTLTNPGEVHGLWLGAFANQAKVRRIMRNRERSADTVAQAVESVNISIEAISSAVDTLNALRISEGEATSEGVREAIAAFLVSLAENEGTIEPRALRLLNTVLDREDNAEQYIERYAEELIDDKATEGIVQVVLNLSQYHFDLAVLVCNETEELSRTLINIDGVYDEDEWERLSTLRQRVGEAMGVETEPVEKPAEA